MSKKGLLISGVILAASITPTWSDAIQIVRATPGSNQARLKELLVIWYIFVAIIVIFSYQLVKN